MRKAAKAKKVKPPEPDPGLPTTWRTYVRETGGFKKIRIVDMENSHLLAAIAWCERKAVDYQHMTNLSPIETARQLWPGYVALVAEAERRFGPSTRTVIPAARVIILPDSEKEDV
jgi:hypothetical protein